MKNINFPSSIYQTKSLQMNHILIAPNSFRDSLDAFQVADIIERAFLTIDTNFHITKMPIADGGDFTGAVLVKALNGTWRAVEVLDPLKRTIRSKIGIVTLNHQSTAIIELAEASGTKLLNRSELNPIVTTTFGTGQLIKAALEMGCQRIIIGVGGSATVDGGMGIMQALGVQFFDKTGRLLDTGGGQLERIAHIDHHKMDKRIANCDIIVPCDVDNALLGEQGAAMVFGPQKGATPTQVQQLENGLANYAHQVQRHLQKDITTLKHGGAAGGVSAGLHAFFNAQLVSGSAFILDTIGFDAALKKADLVITAEGKLDSQTLGGKAPYAVALRAKQHNKPVIAFAGQVPTSDLPIFDGVFSIINAPMPLAQAIEQAETLLFGLAMQVAKFYRLGWGV